MESYINGKEELSNLVSKDDLDNTEGFIGEYEPEAYVFADSYGNKFKIKINDLKEYFAIFQVLSCTKAFDDSLNYCIKIHLENI
jgi:hypothetical protein